MIVALDGVIGERLDDMVVLNVSGVGYGVRLCVEDFGALSSGSRTKLYIYEHIRENTYDLYGFRTLQTKQLFELLLNVNGVGPKMALNVLGVGSVQDVRLAIAEGNTKLIQAASGVGKRVAERVVVDLKDKVGLSASETATTFLQTAVQSNDEALQGLIALGFSPPDAARALGGIDSNLPSEQRIKLALKVRP